jgi:hypothetical protein
VGGQGAWLRQTLVASLTQVTRPLVSPPCGMAAKNLACAAKLSPPPRECRPSKQAAWACVLEAIDVLLPPYSPLLRSCNLLRAWAGWPIFCEWDGNSCVRELDRLGRGRADCPDWGSTLRARDSPGKGASNGSIGWRRAPELCGAAAWRASVHQHPMLQKGLEMLRWLRKLAADGAKLTNGCRLRLGRPAATRLHLHAIA